jgi:hypothetical protein
MLFLAVVMDFVLLAEIKIYLLLESSIQPGYTVELTRLYQEFLVHNPPNIIWLIQDCGQTNQEL